MRSTLQRCRLLLSAALLGLLLGSCATPPAAGPVLGNPDFRQHQAAVLAHANWRLEGRLAIRQGNDSSTVTINWYQHDESFDITLRGSLLPLGTTRLQGSDVGLVLERAGQDPVRLPNLQALTRDYLNFEFPAGNLQYWVRGLPAPGLRASTELDAANLLLTLQQTDVEGRRWDLKYDRYLPVAGLPLPGRIRLSTAAATGGLQLTFLVSDWQLSPP